MLRVRFIRADAPPRKRAQTLKNILKGSAKNALRCRVSGESRLIAEADKTVSQIAAQCRISERGIYRWKAAPEFQARVREHVAKPPAHADQAPPALAES
jgi:hypothetical protein